MVFSSITFLFYFFPIVLALYYMFFFSRHIQNIILLVASLFFYAWGEPKAVLIMMGSIIFNYLFGILADHARRAEKYGKVVIAADVAVNISILFIFKYLVFTVQSINSFGGNLTVPNIALPIGISFYTFQAISYVVDVYRGNGEVQKNPLNVGLYIAFFPQLVAGPIVRYTTFAGQIWDRKESLQKVSFGACRFIVGLGKKVLLSNQMAIVADQLISLQKTDGLSVAAAWIGAIAYMLQIYFDFSGYSDMAIGLGLMFGFKFERNFNYPYISKSIGEFWRRWHISLSSWFRDYVYIPLGGSRVANRDLVIRNLAIVWLLTGIWHGANWTFLLWGVLNMVFIITERLTEFEKNDRIPAALKHIYALLVICIGWVLFRADTLTDAGNYLGNMFNVFGHSLVDANAFMFLKEFGIFFLAAILFSMPIASMMNGWLTKGIAVRKIIQTKKPFRTFLLQMEAPFTTLLSVLYPVVMIALLVVSVTYLVKGNYNPFIYFKF